jgi:hypothetical protein
MQCVECWRHMEILINMDLGVIETVDWEANYMLKCVPKNAGTLISVPHA